MAARRTARSGTTIANVAAGDCCILARAQRTAAVISSGTLSQLVSYTGFAVVLFAGVAVCAVFVLRRRLPDAHRPFRAWGYPWAPAVFILASFVMVANEVWRNPVPTAAGLAIIASGLPVYFVMRRARSV